MYLFTGDTALHTSSDVDIVRELLVSEADFAILDARVSVLITLI